RDLDLGAPLARSRARWPRRNKELVEVVAARIERYPASYDQGHYGEAGSCSSTFCVGGHGGDPLGCLPTGPKSYDPPAPAESQHREVDWTTVWRPGEVIPASVQEVATIEFGLTRNEANVLFNGGWRPRSGSVPEALRCIGEAERISTLTRQSSAL